MTGLKTIPKVLTPRIRVACDQRIPKIIWQTMETNLVPKVIGDSAISWIEKNPEYEYRFFDDKDRYKFIKKEFSHYLRAYRKIKHGAVKADLWRYLIIYKYGGVYADIDSKCIVSLREWINPRSLWVTHLGVNRDVCQWPIMTVPENPIFKRAAEKSYEFKSVVVTGLRFAKVFLSRTYHPIMTFAGPPILQQAAEECLRNATTQEIFKFTQVVCVSDKRQCEMNGNVSHDCQKDEYLKALIDMSIPHYEGSIAQLSRFGYLYAGIMRRLSVRPKTF
jgi:mannosyltransferase OCH1-like enzyme